MYFGSLGIFYPYFALYLREMPVLPVQKWVDFGDLAVYRDAHSAVLGTLADRTGARSRMLALLTLGTALGYLGLGSAAGFWSIIWRLQRWP